MNVHLYDPGTFGQPHCSICGFEETNARHCDATGKPLIEILAEVAKSRIGIRTLDTQNSDSMDFHSIAVWNLKAALEAAYQLGVASTVLCTSCGIRGGHAYECPRNGDC